MDWTKAAQDARVCLAKDRRVYKPGDLVLVIDDVVAGRTPTEIMARRGFKRDLIVTALGHVTKAVHGGGAVPNLDKGGWYRHKGECAPYDVAEGFRSAWLAFA